MSNILDARPVYIVNIDEVSGGGGGQEVVIPDHIKYFWGSDLPLFEELDVNTTGFQLENIPISTTGKAGQLLIVAKTATGEFGIIRVDIIFGGTNIITQRRFLTDNNIQISFESFNFWYLSSQFPKNKPMTNIKIYFKEII